MDTKGSYINFEEDEYTLPEIIDKIAFCYQITIQEKNKKTKKMRKNGTYYDIYRTIKKRFDEIIDEEEVAGLNRPSERKTNYPVKLINRVVNEELGPYFVKFACETRRQALEKYEEQAKKWVRDFEDGTYGNFEAELNEYREEMRSPEHEADHLISAMFQQYKFDLLMDIVFNHLIILDEEKLKTHLSLALTFGDNFPEARDMEAQEQLSDYRNYYRWRTKALADLLNN